MPRSINKSLSDADNKRLGELMDIRNEIQLKAAKLLNKTTGEVTAADRIKLGLNDAYNNAHNEVRYINGDRSPRKARPQEEQALMDERSKIKADTADHFGIQQKDVRAHHREELGFNDRFREVTRKLGEIESPRKTQSPTHLEPWFKDLPQNVQQEWLDIRDGLNKYKELHGTNNGADALHSKQHAWRQKYNAIYSANFLEAGARRRAAKLKAIPKWQTKADKKAIKEIYKEAQKISAETGIPHEVDHIFPLQGKHHRGWHSPENMQIVPKRWNGSKNNRVPVNLKELFYQEGLLGD